MPGPRPKYQVELTESQVKEFSELSRCYTAPFGEVQRARILLLAHRNPEMSNAAIARETKPSSNRFWCKYLIEDKRSPIHFS